MATWQQGINSGGFLAGIGAQNENAPKASDINATLGLIRENNELARSGANNVALTGLRGLAGVADIYKQQQQQERKAAFQKGYADAYASGDREQMRNLITAFPEEFEEVRKGMSYVDDAQRDDYGNLALKAQVASSLGQGAFGRFMMDNEQEMRRLGIPPETIAEMQVNDPQGFSISQVIWRCFLSVMRSISISKIKWKVVDLSKGDWMKVCVRLTWRTREDGQISRTLN